MSWKFVFNSSLSDKLWGNIVKANDAARYGGYKFFTWNGWVYDVDGFRTDVKEEDCF